jgi:AraC-like DNA-binding protein
MFQAFQITQQATHEFRDLYVKNTLLVLVEQGEKHILRPGKIKLVTKANEIIVFPAGSFISIENRVLLGSDYRAIGLAYDRALVREVFDTTSIGNNDPVHVSPCPSNLMKQIASYIDTGFESLPTELATHRCLEPLVWLKSLGYSIATPEHKSLIAEIRDILSSDPSKLWDAPEVARLLGCGESTMRRKLGEKKTSFSKIYNDVRLENGLTLLQVSSLNVSEIAMACGFSTPSHFSDAFKKRFSVSPSHIRKVAV